MTNTKPVAQELRKNGPTAESLYRHYKGGEYVVITTAVVEATMEIVVVYRSLAYGYVWTRPIEEWNGTVEYEGATVPRFKRIAWDGKPW